MNPAPPLRYFPGSRRRLFSFLIAYRWLGLLPPALQLIFDGLQPVGGWVLAAALLVSLLLTLFSDRLNRPVAARPALLGLDLLLMAGILALTGLWRSPYLLHAMSPLLAAGFFAGLRGALIASGGLSAALGALSLLGRPAPRPDDAGLALLVVGGFFLFSGTFAYAVSLLAMLRRVRDELVAADRQRAVLHDLTLSLHRAGDVAAVEQEVLEAVTGTLGFRRALLGRVDEAGGVVTGWLERGADRPVADSPARLLHPTRVPLDGAGSAVAAALADRRPRLVADAAADPWLGGPLHCPAAYLLPLVWGPQPLGVLLVELDAAPPGLSRADAKVLEAIARQAALAIGMMESRLRTAKSRAVQEERARIARDIHDTVSQTLFGIVYTLDGSLKLLPADPAAIEPELRWALRAAGDVRRELRQTIHDMWPDELSAEQFQEDLARYAEEVLHEADVTLAFDVRGDFSTLSPPARRSLYRIGQEALTNIAHHAAATEARVCFDLHDQWARLVIRDNGRGFEPQVALNGEYGEEHFGLRGIQARARSLGGSCDVFSSPGEGTSLVVELPATYRGGGGAA